MMSTSKSRLYSVGAVSLALGFLLFLLLAPAVEREAYLAQIRDANSTRWSSAVLHLCWIEPGRAGLNAILPNLEIDHRVGVLAEAEEVGCVDLLDPSLEADFWLWNPDREGAKQNAVALGVNAVDPAFNALETGDEGVRRHAFDVLEALEHELDETQRERLGATGWEPENEAHETPAREFRTAPESGPDPGAEPGSYPARWEGHQLETEELRLNQEDLPKLRLKEPRWEAPEGGILFSSGADGDSAIALDNADAGMVSSDPVPELAPPPERPETEPDAGGERVQQ